MRRGNDRALSILQRRLPEVVVLASVALLVARLAPDVEGKPLFEDEAVTGLISARPLGEALAVVMWDRGGAPAHFLLSHAVLTAHSSAEAVRWLSVALALATVVVCFDLGRRLGGPVAGAGAAVVAATSGMLAVYGSFGRMYALFALAAALAADLFVRALRRPGARPAAAAAAAAWLLPAAHPYGGVAVAVEAVVALVLWRGRDLSPALPAAAIAVAMLPFAVADLRLADRFAVGAEGGRSLATPGEAWEQVGTAVRGFAGGSGAPLVAACALAALGLVVLARREPAVAALTVLWVAVPPVLFVLVETGSEPDLSPRHLIYALPLWSAAVGVGAATLLRALPPPGRIGLGCALALLALLGSQGVADPRSVTYTAGLGSRGSVQAPAAWLRKSVVEGDVLYPYASVFLAGLPEAGSAVALPRAHADQIVRALERADLPAGALYVAVPRAGAPVAETRMERVLARGDSAHAFPSWLLVRARGPFPDEQAVLQAAVRALVAARASLIHPEDEQRGYIRLNLDVLCAALESLGESCGQGARAPARLSTN
ncbi:MAG: hypothetical protein ABR583_01905 [Gaiellaceae bacterium]